MAQGLPQTDMKAIKCSDLMAMDENVAVAAISWYDSYFSRKLNTTSTELTSMATTTGMVLAPSMAQPDQSLFAMIKMLAAQVSK